VLKVIQMEILIFSDIHIHPHKKSAERLEHCIEALDWTFRTALDRGIKNVVFLGDLFHDRQKIDVLTYQKTFEVFERHLIRNDLNVVLLLGNHDLWHYQKLDISSVNPLRNLPGVRVVNSPSVEKISDKGEDFFFGMLPYTHNPIEDLKTIDAEWNSKVAKDQLRVLGGHVSVDGAIWNVRYNTMSDVTIEHDGDMIRVGPDIFSDWDRVFLGHYHAAQKLNENVEYVGSPLQLSFGEAFQDKHIIVFNTEGNKIEYVKNSFSPKHFILKEDEIQKHELTGQFVRLEVEDMADRQLSDVRLKLMEESKVSTLEIKQSPRKEDHVIKDAKAILYKEEEMLEKYVEQANTEGLDKETLIKIGSEICHKEEN
jgi:DNA repair exonuclease SbcCD nuclease subunit